jgi:hypothetical protein
MSEKPTKPKKTITPEQRAKMEAGRKAAAEKRKKEKEELKARVKKEMQEEKKNMKKAVNEAEKQQKDRLNNAKKDNDAKKKIKRELEQLKESMKIEIKKPVEFKKEVKEIKEVLEEIVEDVKEEVEEEVVEEKKEEIKEEKPEEKPSKPVINKTQIEGLFKAKVSEALDNINDEKTKDIFRDTANNYDFNDSVENNINRLMRRAKEKYLSNTETIKAKKEEIEEKIKNDEFERVQLEKQKRLERMRAKYNKLMKSK